LWGLLKKKMNNPLLERLDKGLLLGDGAMGSLLYEHGIPYSECYEQLNLTRPELIQEIHRNYILAGAQVIETNTFGGNRFRLAEHGLADKVRDFNRRGVKIAREIRDTTGEPVLIAGSIGPLAQNFAPGGSLTWDDAQNAFKEQIEALMEGGVDFLLFETFTDFHELCQAIQVAHTVTDLPIVAQAIFTEEGRMFSGQEPAEFLRKIRDCGADVVGLNCHLGPQGSLAIIEKLANAAKDFGYLAVHPNAGIPVRVRGRYYYEANPEYFANYVSKFVEMGAKYIGGCCGTTPEHIAAMREQLNKIKPQEGRKFSTATTGTLIAPPHHDTPYYEVNSLEKAIEKSVNANSTKLAQKLGAKEFVVSVELLPPLGFNPKRMLQAASEMTELGADVVNITDSAMARVRMGSIACANLVQQTVGTEVIVHYTSRDRNLMGLQSDLLGAHANNIRNILCLTGDPPRVGNYPGATGIWDVDSIGLVKMLNQFNNAIDWNGTSIASPANFNIGCAFNPAMPDIETEIERLRKKIASGAQFIMTQPVFDAALLRETLARVGKIDIPILAGLSLLRDYKQTSYLYHEVPGIVVPKSILDRMEAAGDKGMHEGLKIANELLEQIQNLVQGCYLMPPHGKYETAAAMVKLIKG
jgi:methionine synthase / methylenetetrahydrofolate reductase(NADPH)